MSQNVLFHSDLVLTVIIGIIGPNISSCITKASSGTSNRIVGEIFLQYKGRTDVMILHR